MIDYPSWSRIVAIFAILTLKPDKSTQSIQPVNLLEPITTALRAQAEITVDKKPFLKVTFVQNITQGAPVQVIIETPLASTKQSGEFAMHVHRWGNLEEGCDSMGPHFNPDLVTHGDRTDWIRHVGDLGNVYVGIFSKGTTTTISVNKKYAKQFPTLDKILSPEISSDKRSILYNYTDSRISLMGRNSIIGRGLVIHEKPDDFGRGGTNVSLETGNSGGPIGCAVIARLDPLTMPSPLLPKSNSATTKQPKLTVLLDDTMNLNGNKKLDTLLKTDEGDKLEWKSEELDSSFAESAQPTLQAAPSSKKRKSKRPNSISKNSKRKFVESKTTKDNKLSQNIQRNSKMRKRPSKAKQVLNSSARKSELSELVRMMVEIWGEEGAAELLVEAFGIEQLDALIKDNEIDL